MKPVSAHVLPVKRKGFWYLQRRVPMEYRVFDPRGTVYISTNIRVGDDPRGVAARGVVVRLCDDLEAYWKKLANGNQAELPNKLFRAKEAATRFGVPYIPSTELVQDVKELVRRFDLLKTPSLMKDEDAWNGALGAVLEPKKVILVEDIISEFKVVEAAHLRGMSPGQLEKWTDARELVLKQFEKAVGKGKAFHTLTRADALAYRQFLWKKIEVDEITADSANKYLNRFANMYKSVVRYYQMDLPNIFEHTVFRGAEKGKRKAFTAEHIQTVILKDGQFDDINEQARGVLYLLIETGLRLSEACNLRKEAIHLNAKVPYVEVMGVVRKVKTKPSLRKIPLVGVSLMAMKAHPEGFPDYVDREATLSAVLGKAFRSRKLLPDEKQTAAYSIRHTFKDRLRVAPGVTSELIDMLMGHKLKGPDYGDGYPLEFTRDILAKIAFKPPSRV